jgi:hypothetical protein
VLSKADLLEDVWQEAAAVQQQQGQQQQGQGQDETVAVQQQGQQQQQQQPGQDGEVGFEGLQEVQTAVQFAVALPDALKVSSLTEEGFQQLQEELVVLLKSEVALAQLAAAAAADAAAAAAEAEAAALTTEGLLPPT